jgi:AcrR family transcriptional regulator
MPRSAAVTRKRILDAAYGEFRRKGYARVGVDEIAAAAKVTKRTLYYHFDSKDALLAAVLERQHELAVLAWGVLGRACASAAPSDRQNVRRPDQMVVAAALARLWFQPRCDGAC